MIFKSLNVFMWLVLCVAEGKFSTKTWRQLEYFPDMVLPVDLLCCLSKLALKKKGTVFVRKLV